MTAADVVYADVNFTKSAGKNPGETPPEAETTYSEVKIKRVSDTQELVSSAGGSKVTAERAALVILAALSTAAVVALVYISWNYTQTKDSLHQVKALNRNLRESYDELKETLDKTTCPAGVNTTVSCPPCPEDWEENKGRCYFFNEARKNWTLAREQCRQRGADLVRIDGIDEQVLSTVHSHLSLLLLNRHTDTQKSRFLQTQRFLTTTLREKMTHGADLFWIGLTDAETEGEWLWVDGSALNQSLAFWKKSDQVSEPDNWTEENELGEDCARMGDISNRANLNHWWDKDCNFEQKSICEKPADRGHLFCVA